MADDKTSEVIIEEKDDVKTYKVEDKGKFMLEMHDRFVNAYEPDRKGRQEARSDLDFANSDQWPADVKKKRRKAKRPCMTYNRLGKFIDIVTGDMLQNKPGIKVHPVDNIADPKTADTIEGMIRNIEVISDASIVYGTALKSSVACGRGWFRVITKDNEDDVFMRDIKLKRITDQFSVYWDSSAREFELEDAEYMFVTDRMSIAKYRRKYKGKPVSDFEEGGYQGVYSLAEWYNEKSVRIAEYWYKLPTKKIIYLVEVIRDNGARDVMNVYEEDYIRKEMAFKILRKKRVTVKEVWMCKVSGNDILENPVRFDSPFIPIVPVWGKEMFIGNRRITRGVIRHAKDPQTFYNYWRTAVAEVIGAAPKQPFLVTEAMINGLEHIWDNADLSVKPYLQYKPDENRPNDRPTRIEPATIPMGLVNEAQANAEDLYETTGIYPPSLGQKSNETSGKAILARQNKTEISTYEYSANLTRALIHAGKIIISLIPKVYDTDRRVRLSGAEGQPDTFARINTNFDATQNKYVDNKFNDVTMGKYDITVQTGPSFNTRRQEAAATMLELGKAFPEIIPLMIDAIAKNSDWPDADKIAKRFFATLPPEVQAVVKEQEQEGADPEAEDNEEEEREPTEEELLAQQQQQAEQEKEQELRDSEVEKAKFEVAKMASEARNAELEEEKTKAEIRKIEADTARINREETKPEPQPA